MDIIEGLKLMEAGKVGPYPRDETLRLARQTIESLRKEVAGCHAADCLNAPSAKTVNARLLAAVERMGIGVNHIATYRTDRWPDYGSACDAALEKLGAGQEYDMWCCWNAAMCARDELAGPHEQRGTGDE